MATNDVNVTGTQAPLRVLIVEDSPEDFDLCVRTLEKAKLNINAAQVASRESFHDLVATNTYDVILSDYNLGSWNGMEALEILRQQGRDTPFILVTGALGEERAAQCIREGAADLVMKTRLAALPAAVCRALSDKILREVKERAEASLKESERKFRVLADSIASAVLIYQGTQCRYANRAAQTLTGYSGEELLSLSSWDLIHPDSHSVVIAHGLARLRDKEASVRYEMKILTKQGEVRFWDVTPGKIEIESEPAGLITALDVTDRKLAEVTPERGGYHDPLTGLLTGAQVQIVFREEAKRSERTGRSFALLLLKLEALRQNNQELGFAEASRVLCKLANIIGGVCRTSDSASRYTEDEFVLILPETPVAGARRLMQRIGERLKNELSRLPPTISAGIAVFPQDGPTIEHALRSARRTLRRMDGRPTKEFAHSA